MKNNFLIIVIIFTGIALMTVYSQSGNFQGKKRILKSGVNTSKVLPDSNNTKLKPKGFPASKEPRKYPRSADLKLNALSRGDSVILRWAVTTPGGWIVGNKAGYIIERFLIDSSANSEYKILNSSTLKPWTLDEWKKNSARDDKFAAIAAQCLYGKNAIKALENSNKKGDDYVTNLRYASIELSNRHGFATLAADVDAHAATGLALRFVDKDVKQGGSYLYKVKVSYQDTTYYIKEASVYVKIGINNTNFTAPSGLKILENNKKVTLFWPNSEQEGYTAYNLYRSDDGGKNMIKLNKSPILPMEPDNMHGKTKPDNSDIPGSFADSNLINNKTYTYCLRGITMFAEESECATINATPKQQKVLSIGKITVEHSGINQAKIKWEYTNPESEIEGFSVSRSSNFSEGFEFLHEKPLDKSQREFIDNYATEDEPYYIVSVIDTAGNMFRSVPRLLILNDTIPPSKPTGLTGTIDTNGMVDLVWDLGYESNLIGYRVFWANEPDHTFLMVNKSIVEDTTYQDTIKLNTLSKYIYYRIAAVNKRYISSEYSDIIKLSRPDIVPPQKAVFTKFVVTDSSVNLSWEPSLSEDATKQFVKRRLAGVSNWEKIAELPITDRFYTDKNISGETSYEYSIETIDESGLKSETTNFIQAKTQKRIKLTSPTELQVNYDKAQNGVILKWQSVQPSNIEPSWITIYRSYDNNNGQFSEMQLFTTTKSTANSYKDKSLIGKGKYRYSILVSTNSGQSAMSKIVEVEVK